MPPRQRVPSRPQGEDALPEALPHSALRYLEHVRFERRLAERTLALYTEDLRKLQQVAAAQGLDVLALQPFYIRQQVARMHSQGRSARGIALILSGWRSFYRWAVLQGLLEVNPVQDVRAPKSRRPLPKALGADEAVQLAAFRQPTVDANGAAQWLELRDAAMTELLYSSGLRIGELLGLDLCASAQAQQQGRGWIDWQEAEAHVIGKGQKRRSVPIGAAAMRALLAWQQVRDPARQWPGQNALFISQRGARMSPQSAWQRLRQRSQAAGMAMPVHPHMLRHSFASHVLQSSGDLRAVQELLGHANISTTQIYTRLDFQHLARIYDAAHPRARAGGVDVKAGLDAAGDQAQSIDKAQK
ncbi:tyrosine recombinase XerC [Vandammella animalimorsus]|uniref:Tyrosine recombinase XerC n=1 Tax=Vandammella animalimorsus TaxID=2029117 RepID=A0A2A2AB28_9BURK|nr:tyrosine recombinase XerC [Vandammella animalimorsus]PAT35740.1 recombinase XerC [Vandammella animalimorsus]